MARVIIVKEFTEEVNSRLLSEVKQNNSLIYATDNKQHCVVIPKGKRSKLMIKVVVASVWHTSVTKVDIDNAEVWEQ